MNDKKIERIINVLYSIATIALLLGGFFKLQHYPHGNILLGWGFILGTIVGVYDNIRLKKIIRKLEERKFDE
jgi:hypothetical membrane protein